MLYVRGMCWKHLLCVCGSGTFHVLLWILNDDRAVLQCLYIIMYFDNSTIVALYVRLDAPVWAIVFYVCSNAMNDVDDKL